MSTGDDDDIDEVPIPQRFRPLLEGIVNRLVAGEFDAVDEEYSVYGHSRGDLGLWAREYPPLVPLSPEKWDETRCFQVDGCWEIPIELWSEPGRMPLTLIVEVTETEGQIEIGVVSLRPM